MIIQATKKLQDFIGIKPEVIEKSASLEVWHGNIFMIGRRKSLLLTHNESLYSIFIYGITKKELKNFAEIIKKNLGELMRRDSFTIPQIANVLASIEKINYTKTSSKKVLGSMNDMVHMLKYYDMTEDELSLAQRINNTPYKVGGYIYPREALRGLLDSQGNL